MRKSWLFLAWAAAAPACMAGTLSANLAWTSQYISRGFQQTWGRPAWQGGIDYAAANGLQAGAWLSTVSGKFIEGGRAEWDLYAGYAATRGDLAYSAQLYAYRYPGARSGATGLAYDYRELALGLSYRWASVKYYRTLTRDFFGFAEARGTGYLDLGAAADLGAGLVLQAHAGAGRIRNWSDYNWNDYKLGLAKNYASGWTVSLAYTRGQNATGAYERYPAADGTGATSNPLRGQFALGASKSF